MFQLLFNLTSLILLTGNLVDAGDIVIDSGNDLDVEFASWRDQWAHGLEALYNIDSMNETYPPTEPPSTTPLPSSSSTGPYTDPSSTTAPLPSSSSTSGGPLWWTGQWKTDWWKNSGPSTTPWWNDDWWKNSGPSTTPWWNDDWSMWEDEGSDWSSYSWSGYPTETHGSWSYDSFFVGGLIDLVCSYLSGTGLCSPAVTEPVAPTEAPTVAPPEAPEDDPFFGILRHLRLKRDARQGLHFPRFPGKVKREAGSVEGMETVGEDPKRGPDMRRRLEALRKELRKQMVEGGRTKRSIDGRKRVLQVVAEKMDQAREKRAAKNNL